MSKSTNEQAKANMLKMIKNAKSCTVLETLREVANNNGISGKNWFKSAFATKSKAIERLAKSAELVVDDTAVEDAKRVLEEERIKVKETVEEKERLLLAEALRMRKEKESADKIAKAEAILNAKENEEPLTEENEESFTPVIEASKLRENEDRVNKPTNASKLDKEKEYLKLMGLASSRETAKVLAEKGNSPEAIEDYFRIQLIVAKQMKARFVNHWCHL